MIRHVLRVYTLPWFHKSLTALTIVKLPARARLVVSTANEHPPGSHHDKRGPRLHQSIGKTSLCVCAWEHERGRGMGSQGEMKRKGAAGVEA